MKKFAAAVIASLFLIPAVSSAAIVTNTLNHDLPELGVQYYDLDGDGLSDLGLAESCCAPNKTYVNGFNYTTQYQYAWLSAGTKVDASLAWTSGNDGYTPVAPNLSGVNYLAVRNTSIGDYFGYLAIAFRNEEQTLVGYTYDNTGAAITVGGEVPEPATFALLGLGMAAIGLQRRRKLRG